MSEERKLMANIAPFGLRMQPDLRARVEAAAKQNNRSLNAEIIDRLEESFSKPKADYNAVSKAVAILEQRNAELQAQILKRRQAPPPGSSGQITQTRVVRVEDEEEKLARDFYRERTAELSNVIDRLDQRMAQLEMREKEMIDTIRQLRREEAQESLSNTKPQE